MLAQDYMTKAVVTAHPDDLVVDVRKMMQDEGVRHVPIVEDGGLVGIVRGCHEKRRTDLWT